MNNKESLNNTYFDKSDNDLPILFKPEEPKQKKFKMAVLSVMNRIKILAKGNVEEENLPDPSELPITSSCHLSLFALATSDDVKISKGFQEKFQDDIDLNMSLSKTGTCVLYRDVKTKHCVVRDISNEKSCRGFFEWYSCYHIMPESAKIIILDLNLNIIQAFHSLLDNKTRAAPIWDSQNQQFLAMFTITDFIRLMHKYYHADKSVIERIPYHSIKDWKDMMDSDSNSRMIHISPEHNLRQAASVIVQHNIHRLPVIDPLNGNILAIITNSQLFQFFYERFLMKRSKPGIQGDPYIRNPNLPLPSYFRSKIGDLQLGNYDDAISTIHPWQTVFEAFDIFVKNHISVLPVVDADHRLIDIYARYDVISISESVDYKNLEKTIFESLKNRKKIMHPCTCSKEDKFGSVLETIYKAQVHRIFVIDAQKHILGVISLTDILSFLCGMNPHSKKS